MSIKSISKKNKTLYIIVGCLFSIVGLFIPYFLSLIISTYNSDKGGVSLLLFFVCSSPLLGYELGNLTNETNEIDISWVLLGVFLGFSIFLVISILNTNNNYSTLFTGIYCFAIIIAFFLSNHLNLFKKSDEIEKKIKIAISKVNLLGIYQYLYSNYLAHFNSLPLPFYIFFLVITIILLLFFFPDLRELIPKSTIVWFNNKLSNPSNTTSNDEKENI